MDISCEFGRFICGGYASPFFSLMITLSNRQLNYGPRVVEAYWIKAYVGYRTCLHRNLGFDSLGELLAREAVAEIKRNLRPVGHEILLQDKGVPVK